MTLIAAGSAHGSPGVTTTLELLASALPERTRVPVVVEADDAGGVLAARHVMPVSPGMATLAEALRRAESPSILDHAQQLPSGIAIVPLTPALSAARTQLRTAGAALGPYLESLPEMVFADLGAVAPGTTVEHVIERASVMLWFVRPVREEITLLHRRLQEVSASEHASIVVVGTEPYGAEQIEEALELPVMHTIPFDRKGANALQLGGADRTLARSKLARSCRSLALKLEEETAAGAPVALSQDETTEELAVAND